MPSLLAPAAVVVRRTIAASAEDLFEPGSTRRRWPHGCAPAPSAARSRRSNRASAAATRSPCRANPAPFLHSGVYRLIDRPKRLVFTWHLAAHRTPARRWSPSISCAVGRQHRSRRHARAAARERAAVALATAGPAVSSISTKPAQGAGTAADARRCADIELTTLHVGATRIPGPGARPARCAGRWKKPGSPYDELQVATTNGARRDTGRGSPSARCRCIARTASSCSSPARSCCTSRSELTACCRPIRPRAARKGVDVRRAEFASTRTSSRSAT